MAEMADIFNCNTEAFVRSIEQLNRRCRKLEKRNCSLVLAGIIFGAIIEYRMIEQNRRMGELEKRFGELRMKIEEFRDKEGD
ncbi:MAG: hypothetical protein HFG80_05920 [Eubacterium sp.]|nr:hypothetical protein [Eubacterium sp.]